MTEIVGKPRYWATRKDANWYPLRPDQARVFIMDQEAWTYITVTDEFVSDAVGMPKLLFDILERELTKFKETHAQIGW